ncbi:MAG TPA: hypothetical protein VNA15_12635 [Candidatus Angelobacter sp.]|nr:hypothetical protein [Candidatus Angelobacter sp.]
MGLNDLTIEKLITEINGYKEKMQTIHEEYGHASQDLQDRINVLGYTLNEHLKATKDQMATTPQRLLNLEMKFVTGDVNESEYRAQRAEFKGLLENNLKSIEEIKQMIDTLSRIETRPLVPQEFKQTYPENKPPASISWVGIGALASAKPWTPTQPQPITPVTSNPAQATLPPSNVVEEHVEPTPAPLIPQSNGTGSPTPETTNAPSTTPLNALAASTVPVTAPVASSNIAPSNTLDESFNLAPSQDVAEDIADALVVKVVDDIPTLDASAAVATTEPSQVQPAIPGTETVPGIQGSPDLSSVGLAPPSQFYKVVCPKCGADVPKPAKVWELKGGKSKKNVLIGLFQCQDCRVKFREALTREIL